MKRRILETLLALLATIAHTQVREQSLIRTIPTWEDGSKAVLAKKKAKTKSRSEATSIPLKAPEVPKVYSFFAGIPQNVITQVEIGSPQSLQQALATIRKSEIDYTEKERVFVAVAQNILQLVYPSQKIEGALISASSKNSYMGAIQSALKGVFDTSTGNVDFLATVLPCLVVIKKSDLTQIFSDVQTSLQAGLKLRPNSVLAHFLMATLYKKAKMFENASYEFLTAKGLAPDCFEILYSYCECLSAMGKATEANQVIASLIEKNPTSRDLLTLAATTAFSLGNLNGADEYISRILQQDPNDLEALLFRAKVLFQKKDYIRVASLLDMYARQNTTNRDYLLLRAQLQYEWNHNTSAAVASITQAVRLYGEDSEVLLMAARISSLTYTKIDGKTSAQFANAVLEKDSKNAQALQYSIDALSSSGDYKAAYETSKAVMARGQDVSTQDGLNNTLRHALICVKAGHSDEALSLIKPLYDSMSQNEAVTQAYITVLSQTGGAAQALRLINELLGTSTSRFKSFLFYARSQLQQTSADAINDLRSALMNNPRNTDALFRFYKIYYEAHDYRKAQYYLKQVVAMFPNNEEYQKLSAELSRLLGQ